MSGHRDILCVCVLVAIVEGQVLRVGTHEADQVQGDHTLDQGRERERERERGGGSLGFNRRVFWKMYNAHFAK